MNFTAPRHSGASSHSWMGKAFTQILCATLLLVASTAWAVSLLVSSPDKTERTRTDQDLSPTPPGNGAVDPGTTPDGLTEWFINDTRGLEQGWTLAHRPASAGPTGPVRLDFTVRGSLRPKVSPEGASVAFMNDSGSAALTYGGLKAWDANGNTVQVRFLEGEGGGDALSVVVDDAAATYPITVDPIAQQAYLKASNAGAYDHFGHSVAVSGDTYPAEIS
jgi:hypothetical protein